MVVLPTGNRLSDQTGLGSRGGQLPAPPWEHVPKLPDDILQTGEVVLGDAIASLLSRRAARFWLPDLRLLLFDPLEPIDPPARLGCDEFVIQFGKLGDLLAQAVGLSFTNAFLGLARDDLSPWLFVGRSRAGQRPSGGIHRPRSPP